MCSSDLMSRSGVSDKHEGEIHALYDEAQAQYQQMNNGQKPPDDWRADKINAIAAEIKVMRPGFLNDSGMKPLYQFEQFSSEIPAEHTTAVLAAFGDASQGEQKLAEADLEIAYRRAMAAFKAGGINSPTELAITQMIQSQRGGME